MLKKIVETIEKYQLIDHKDRLIIGVSGGPDSVCLLHSLWMLKETYDIALAVVHLDHEYRGEASAADALYVKNLCEELGVKAYIHAEPIEELAKQRGMSFEEMARERRYALFFQAAQDFNANRIAVAHNRNDQVETFLMRVMRGTGIDGMVGIPYKRDDGVVRPLLDIDRSDIENYCKTHNLKPRTDATNLEAIYTRNRIRLEMVPYIEKHFNGGFQNTLLRNLDLIKEDVDYLKLQTKEAFNQMVCKKKHEWLIPVDKFVVLHPAIQKRVLRHIIETFTGTCQNISLKNIQGLLGMIHKNETGKVHILPNGLRFKMNYNQISIGLKEQETLKDFDIKLNIGSLNVINELGLEIMIKPMSNSSNFKATQDAKCIMIDAERVNGTLKIRNRIPGDRFKPLGLGGTKKIKDYFIDHKVERKERDQIPLLCDDTHIIWVMGYQMDERYRITKDTNQFLQITFKSLQVL